MKKKTILLWWLFVTALEPGKFKIPCLDRFLATTIVLTLQGSLNFLAHILDLMWLRFCWALPYYFCFVLMQNEFFNVSSALKEYCFFPRKVKQSQKITCTDRFLATAITCTFLEDLHNFLAHLYLMRAVTFLLNTTVLFSFGFSQNEFFIVPSTSILQQQLLFLSISSSLTSDNLPPLTTWVNY